MRTTEIPTAADPPPASARPPPAYRIPYCPSGCLIHEGFTHPRESSFRHWRAFPERCFSHPPPLLFSPNSRSRNPDLLPAHRRHHHHCPPPMFPKTRARTRTPLPFNSAPVSPWTLQSSSLQRVGSRRGRCLLPGLRDIRSFLFLCLGTMVLNRE